MSMAADLVSEPLFVPVQARSITSFQQQLRGPATLATAWWTLFDDDVLLQETKHMLPQLMELLRGVHALRPAAVQIHDTHSKDPVQQPAGQVDCSLLASDLRRWTSMVVPVVFKVEDSEVATALGQLVTYIRHTLQQQPERQRAFAVVITMQSIEVFQFINVITRL